MLNKIVNLIRLAVVSRVGVGGGQFPVQQLTYNGKTGDSMIVYPFGIHANAPADSLAIMFSINAQTESRAAIVMSNARPELEPGEVAMYHPGTGSIVKMSADGSVKITATTIELDGDVTISGGAEISGNLTVSGKDFIDHTHAQDPDSNGNTQQETKPLS